MGPGGTITAAQAALGRGTLEAWGGAIATALAETAPTLQSVIPTPLAIGRYMVKAMPEDAIRTQGWELRHAFAWHNDNRCIQRAAFGAMALAERGVGSLHEVFGRAAVSDGWRSAIAVAYHPSNFSGARLHAAATARSTNGELLVIDHLATRADDGVLSLDDWLRRIGGREDTTMLVPATHMPPLSSRGGPGIPAYARPNDGARWREFADHLSLSWEEGAARRLDQVQPLRQAAPP